MLWRRWNQTALTHSALTEWRGHLLSCPGQLKAPLKYVPCTCLKQISSIVVENGCSPSVDLLPIMGRNMIVFPLLTLLLLLPMLMLLSLLLLSLLLSLLLLLLEFELDPKLAAREREDARKLRKVKVETAPPVSQAGSPSTFFYND